MKGKEGTVVEGKRKEKKRGLLLEEVILESSAVFLRLLLADILCKPSTWQAQKSQLLTKGCILIIASTDFLITNIPELSYSVQTSFNSIITLWPRACFSIYIV